MLHMFQRVESIHETQVGFSLEYQNKHAWYIFGMPKHTYDIYNILFSVNCFTNKWYSYLVCV